uniref:Uncharacterized protein n=1 Tax=Picea glauca TaxID=3330 RepID=A0A117NJ28_PICGL|nr:hypothetical protein ABT39_MTgene701 [Picea glauca]
MPTPCLASNRNLGYSQHYSIYLLTYYLPLGILLGNTITLDFRLLLFIN